MMAKNRCFCFDVLQEKQFCSLSFRARWLYILLNYEADNDGFIRSVDYVLRICSAGIEDLEALVSIGYLIRFDTGVLLISHWNKHHSIRPDRRGKTAFQEELSQIVSDSSGIYRLKSAVLEDNTVSKPDTKPEITKPKSSIRKSQPEKSRVTEKKTLPRFTPPSLDEVKAFIEENQYHVDPQKWFSYYEANGWMVGKNKMKSWEASIRYWEHNNKSGGRNDSRSTSGKSQKRDYSDDGFQYYDS